MDGMELPPAVCMLCTLYFTRKAKLLSSDVL